MKTVSILISFDVESPYGAYGLTDAGKKEHEQNFVYMKQIRERLNALNIKRTYFILGDHLFQQREMFGNEELKNIFEPDNPLSEIAQHTYTHGVAAPIPTRPDRIPMTASQFKEELIKTNALIKECFGMMPLGVRMPLGYVNGFQSYPELAEIIKQTGLKYVNADSRSPEGDIYLPLVANGKKRQPYFYSNGLLEIPAHGWHDTAFCGRTKTLGRRDGKSWASSEIIAALSKVIEDAAAQSDDVCLSMGFHPWCMRLYDPALSIFDDFIHKISGDASLTHTELCLLRYERL